VTNPDPSVRKRGIENENPEKGVGDQKIEKESQKRKDLVEKKVGQREAASMISALTAQNPRPGRHSSCGRGSNPHFTSRTEVTRGRSSSKKNCPVKVKKIARRNSERKSKVQV